MRGIATAEVDGKGAFVGIAWVEENGTEMQH